MKVADLFLHLGLDGAGDVSKGLGKVSGSLKELFSMSIQTKLTLGGIAAGLTGAAFSAGKTGKDLMAFHYAFDLSTKEMQKFSWATRQFGIDNQEAMGYVEGLQDLLAQSKYNGDVAQSFYALGIDPTKMKDAFQVAKEIAEKAKTANPDFYRLMGEVMSPQMVAANRMMAQRGGLQSWMNKTPAEFVRTEKQLEQQRRIAVAFENFSNNLKATMDNFITKNEPLITKLINEIEKLLETMLNWIGKQEGKSGLIKDIVKGENIPVAVAKATGRGILGIGSTMNEAAIEGVKSIGAMLKAGAQDLETQRLLNSTAKKGTFNQQKAARPETSFGVLAPKDYEEQQGNTTTININGVQFEGEQYEHWKQETMDMVSAFTEGTR